ncbi:MAG: CBS domain-containing protein [Candidatus Omnitrophica bacterium]|nr:CBS domain-containing protein [Candidatus Omnitrophota bacterium]
MGKLIKLSQKENTPFALKISDDIIKTTENVSVREVAKILEENRVGAVIIEREGNLVGIISERDIVWRVVALGKSPDDTKASEIMTRNVVTVDLAEGMDKIYDVMKKLPFRHLPIRKGNRVIGMVSNRDLMYLRKLKAVQKID